MSIEQRKTGQTFDQQQFQQLNELVGTGWWPNRFSEELVTEALRKNIPLLRQTLQTGDHCLDTINLLHKVTLPGVIDDFPIVGEISTSFVADNIQLIEESVQEDAPGILPGMRLAERVICYGDGHQKQILSAFIGRNFLSAVQTGEIQHYEFRGHLIALREYSVDPETELAGIVSSALKSNNPRILDCTPSLLWTIYSLQEGKRTKEVESLETAVLQRIVGRFGLKIGHLVRAWEEASTQSFSKNPWILQEVFERNFESILNLERQVPNITGWLQSKFGIANFYRYPPEVLIRQYHDRDNVTIPYGVLFQARSDSKGAFYEHKKIYEKFFFQLQELGCTLRVAECGSVFELIHALNRIRRRYGKLSFGIVSGHGEPNNIRLGNQSRRGLLYKEDIIRIGRPVFLQAFEEFATLILISCSTGVPNGIAKAIKTASGLITFAPNKDTGLEGIGVERDENKNLQFDVRYSSPSDTEVF